MKIFILKEWHFVKDLFNNNLLLQVGPSSAKRYDLSKMVKMASISEESCLELNKSKDNLAQDELVSKMNEGHYRKKSLSTSHTESSKRSKKDNSRVESMPKRKSTLKKIWYG